MEEQTSSKQRLIGLNKLLSEIFCKEIRLSLLLQELGFSDEQISIIRKDHLNPLIQLTLETLKEFIYSRSDADRLWLILCERFGLRGNRVKTLQEIGTELGISRERVRQLEEKAIRKLVLPRRKSLLLDRLKMQASDWLIANSATGEAEKAPSVNKAAQSDRNPSVPDYVLEQRKVNPRAYEPWTMEEDRFLEAQFKQGKTIKQLSDLFQRNESAIKSRLRKKGLTDNSQELLQRSF